MSVGIYFFKFPNNFSTGGVSALALILSSLVPQVTPSEYMLVTNIILLFAGGSIREKIRFQNNLLQYDPIAVYIAV